MQEEEKTNQKGHGRVCATGRQNPVSKLSWEEAASGASL